MAVKKTKVKKRALKQAVTDGFANLLGSLKSMIGHRAAATRTACKTVGVTLTNPSRQSKTVPLRGWKVKFAEVTYGTWPTEDDGTQMHDLARIQDGKSPLFWRDARYKAVGEELRLVSKDQLGKLAGTVSAAQMAQTIKAQNSAALSSAVVLQSIAPTLTFKQLTDGKMATAKAKIVCLKLQAQETAATHLGEIQAAKESYDQANQVLIDKNAALQTALEESRKETLLAKNLAKNQAGPSSAMVDDTEVDGEYLIDTVKLIQTSHPGEF